MIKNPGYFWSGIGVFLILILSSLIKIRVESGLDYVINSSLLGAIIFYNPIVLVFYIVLGMILISKGLKK